MAAAGYVVYCKLLRHIAMSPSVDPSSSSTPLPPPLTDLGFQAAQRIMSASPDLALKVMKDIAQNLPMVAK